MRVDIALYQARTSGGGGYIPQILTWGMANVIPPDVTPSKVKKVYKRGKKEKEKEKKR